MRLKPIIRYLYSVVPGLAPLRFAIMDVTASWAAKPEYAGAASLSINDGVIIDVGASRGQSAAAFRKLAPNATIMAFEPDPRSASRMAARHRGNTSIVVESCALGAQHGTITFFLPIYGRWDCDGMAAIDRATATDWLRDAGRMYRFDEHKLSVTEHPVECRTLDSFDLSPRLIKLHAQGAELNILRGATETIRRSEPALMCAFPTSELTEFADQFGYSPYIYTGDRFVSGVAERPITFTWYLTAEHLSHLSNKSPS